MTTRKPEFVLLKSASDQDAAYAMQTKLQERHITAEVRETRLGWRVWVDSRDRESAKQILGIG